MVVPLCSQPCWGRFLPLHSLGPRSSYQFMIELHREVHWIASKVYDEQPDSQSIKVGHPAPCTCRSFLCLGPDTSESRPKTLQLIVWPTCYYHTDRWRKGPAHIDREPVRFHGHQCSLSRLNLAQDHCVSNELAKLNHKARALEVRAL